jgi:nucleoid-associated protein EbfC
LNQDRSETIVSATARLRRSSAQSAPTLREHAAQAKTEHGGNRSEAGKKDHEGEADRRSEKDRRSTKLELCSVLGRARANLLADVRADAKPNRDATDTPCVSGPVAAKGPLMQFRGGMNELVRQAARMQRKIDQVKEEIKDRAFTVGAASDKIKVTATCEGKITRVEVDPEFLQTEGLELVCDAIAAAANGALSAADKAVEQEVAKVTGGLKMPNLPG